MGNSYQSAFEGRGNLPSTFPNDYFGKMTLDSRDRETDYFPGQAFASSSGGIPIPGPFGPLISQMLVNPWLASKGIILPAVRGYSGSAYDFSQAQQRNLARSAGQKGITEKLIGMGFPGLGETDIGKSEMAIQLSEMFDLTYGGSQLKATDSLASRMSYMQKGTDINKNYKDVADTALAIREGFSKQIKPNIGMFSIREELTKNKILDLAKTVGRDDIGKFTEEFSKAGGLEGRDDSVEKAMKKMNKGEKLTEAQSKEIIKIEQETDNQATDINKKTRGLPFEKQGEVLADEIKKRDLDVDKTPEQIAERNAAVEKYKKGKPTSPSVEYDYKKSYGFNMSESVENLMSGLRYGNIGLSREEFTNLSQTTDGQKQISSITMAQNEKTRMGKQTFGSEMSADQINKLVDAAMGGIAGVTPEKSTEFLAKIQTTSRALNVNARAFTEYVAMQQNLYKQMGISGASAADSIMTAAITGDTVSQISLGKGGRGGMMANADTAREASARNTARQQGSGLINNARAVAAIYDMMTPAQRIASGAGAKLKELEESISSGDSPKAKELISEISKKTGFSDTYRIGAHMNSDMSSRADNQISLEGRGDAESFRRKHLQTVSALTFKGLTTEEKEQMGNREGLAEAIKGSSLGSAEDIADFLQESNPSMTPAMALDIGAKVFSKSATVLGSGKDYTGAVEKLTVSSKKGKKELREKKEANKLSTITNLVANDRIGYLAKQMGISDVVGFATKFIAEGGMSGSSEDIINAISKITQDLGEGEIDKDKRIAINKYLESNVEDAKAIIAAGKDSGGKDLPPAEKLKAETAKKNEIKQKRNLEPGSKLTDEEYAEIDKKVKEDKEQREKAKEKAREELSTNVSNILGTLQAIFNGIKPFFTTKPSSAPAAPKSK